MTDRRKYRIALDEDVMEAIRAIANKHYNRNATKATNVLLRKAMKAQKR
jgi:hypothetical protein